MGYVQVKKKTFLPHTLSVTKKYFGGRFTKATEAQSGATLSSVWEIPGGKKKGIEKSCVLGGRERLYRNQFHQTQKVVVWWQQGHHENAGHHGHIRESQLFLQTEVGSPSPHSPEARTTGLQEGVPAWTTVQQQSAEAQQQALTLGQWFAGFWTEKPSCLQQLLWSHLDLCPPASFFSCKTTLHLNGRWHGVCLKHVDQRFSTFYTSWHT